MGGGDGSREHRLTWGLSVLAGAEGVVALVDLINLGLLPGLKLLGLGHNSVDENTAQLLFEACKPYGCVVEV